MQMQLLASAGELLTIKENAVVRFEPVGTSSELEPLPSVLEICCRVTHARCKNLFTWKNTYRIIAVAGQHSVSDQTTASQTEAQAEVKKRKEKEKEKTQIA